MFFEPISRRAAADQGMMYYYTGKPCKHGHVAKRYVQSGACLGCAKYLYKPRHSPITGDLVPFMPTVLFAPKSYTRDEFLQLRYYLQTCIYAHARATGHSTVGIETAASHHELNPIDLKNPNLIP